MNTSEWRPSPVFPNHYLVSSDGDVYSIASKKVLKPATDKYGYLYYTLCVNGERRCVKAHRLIATAFIPNPYGKPTVNHKNGIKTDNRIGNLEWATNKEQTNDPLTLAHMKTVWGNTDYQAMGMKRNYGRLPVTVETESGELFHFPSLRSAAQTFGFNYGHLSETINGKRPQPKGFSIAVTKLRFPEDDENAD